MLTLNIQIKLEGAAIEDGGVEEVLTLLQKAGAKIQDSGLAQFSHGAIIDTNGNGVGGWSIDEPR